MEKRSEVVNGMRQHLALRPMASGEKQQSDAEDCEVAIVLIRKTRRASVSHFQLHLGWGYNHAARILDLLRTRGVVGEKTGPRSYEILTVVEQEA